MPLVSVGLHLLPKLAYLLHLLLQLLVELGLLVHGTSRVLQQLGGMLQVTAHLVHNLLQLLALARLQYTTYTHTHTHRQLCVSRNISGCSCFACIHAPKAEGHYTCTGHLHA